MRDYDELQDLASVFRSKSAGPYITTIDIFLRSAEQFEQVRRSGILTRELVAKLYKVPEHYVLGIYYYEPVLAIKISVMKQVSSGDVFCRDIMAAQQHAPFLSVKIPR